MANLSRRSILGGAAALPFIAAPALSAQIASKPDRTAWDRAVARFDGALAALDAAYTAGATNEQLAAPEAEYIDAYQAMIDTPSPDAEALAYKLRAAFGPDFDEEPIPQIRAVVFADALRLAGKAVTHG